MEFNSAFKGLNRVWPDGSSSLLPSKLASAKTLLNLRPWPDSPLR